VNPFFNIYIGPMFGSKTTRLLGDIDRQRHKGKNILTIKPNIDKRYATQKIVSHSGGSVEAICVESINDIYDLVAVGEIYDVIAVDEAFMIEDIDKVLIEFYKSGISIIVSSIQMDAGEMPFQNIKNILPWATKIDICSAVCTKCDQDAYFTKALFDIENATQEERIGSYDLYEPRCMKHYTDFISFN